MQTLLAALGAVVIAPSASPSGAVTPNTVTPGSPVTFSVVCADGVRSADVAGTALGLAERIPMEPGKTSGAFSVTVNIPTSTQEGTFNVSIDCGDGTSTVVQLVVSPAGGVPTGDGATADEPNHMLMAAGGGLLVIGATGALLLRRRRPA
ncbi:LPXTG cell wall anchor domain-containing protein [Dactylosporangium sp. NPDC000555]|uniref:LPXTG cell wall anchor domain-containing protein n=1 Tax=Dactylosporangium sp. NPDC000555 TaxID=3154260 RepID=UPI0033269347